MLAILHILKHTFALWFWKCCSSHCLYVGVEAHVCLTQLIKNISKTKTVDTRNFLCAMTVLVCTVIQLFPEVICWLWMWLFLVILTYFFIIIIIIIIIFSLLLLLLVLVLVLVVVVVVVVVVHEIYFNQARRTWLVARSYGVVGVLSLWCLEINKVRGPNFATYSPPRVYFFNYTCSYSASLASINQSCLL